MLLWRPLPLLQVHAPGAAPGFTRHVVSSASGSTVNLTAHVCLPSCCCPAWGEKSSLPRPVSRSKSRTGGVARGLPVPAYGLEHVDHDYQREQARDGYGGDDQSCLNARHEVKLGHDQEDRDEDDRLESLALEKTGCYLVSAPSGDAY